MLNIRRAKLFDASQRFASAGRSPLWTCNLSTSFNGLSNRKIQDVFSSVLVSIQMLAAVFAFELSDFQTKFGVDMAAGAAPLAAWEEPVSNSQLPTIPSALVSQHRTELPKAGATDMLGELVILDHAAHVQVLNRQNIEATHQVGSQFVQCVLPAVGDLGVQSRYLQPLLIPTATALDATGENPLQPCQPCGVVGGVVRICNPLSVTQGRQPRYSKVNPDLTSSLGERGLGWFIQTKTHEIASIPALGYRAGSRLARETATPFDVKPTDFGNCEVAIVRIPFESVDCVFSRLFAVLGCELGVGCPFGKEVGERRLQVPQSLLLRHTGRLTQPSKLRVSAMLGQCRAAGVVIDRLAVLEAVRAESQGEVIDVTRTAEFTRQLPRLAVCRVASECVAHFHKATIHLV